MKKIIIYGFQLAAAYVLFMAGVMKLSGNEMEIAMFTQIGMEPHGRIIIAMLELLAAVLLLIPQSGLYGAFLGLGIMTGAVIGHLTDIGYEGIENALIVFLCCLIVIFLRRDEASVFKNMFNN